MARVPDRDAGPTVDEYFKAAHELAMLLRKTFDNPKSVRRAALLRALEHFEEIDMEAG